MLVVQVWLVVTVSLLGVLMLVMGGQAAWGLQRSGRGAVAVDTVLSQVAPAEPVARPMVGSTAA